MTPICSDSTNARLIMRTSPEKTSLSYDLFLRWKYTEISDGLSTILLRQSLGFSRPCLVKRARSIHLLFMLLLLHQVSLLDIPAACVRIKGFTRFIYCRSRLRKEIRQQYSRYYSGKNRRHFYVFRRTQEVGAGFDISALLSRVIKPIPS